MCLICDDCGKAKADVSERPCPYAEEIHCEINLVTICDDCDYERAQDI